MGDIILLCICGNRWRQHPETKSSVNFILRGFVPRLEAFALALRDFSFRFLRFQEVGDSIHLVAEGFGVSHESLFDRFRKLAIVRLSIRFGAFHKRS